MLMKSLWQWSKADASDETFNTEMVLQDNNRMELQSVVACPFNRTC
jgi:hypothetical protein